MGWQKIGDIATGRILFAVTISYVKRCSFTAGLNLLSLIQHVYIYDQRLPLHYVAHLLVGSLDVADKPHFAPLIRLTSVLHSVIQ